MNEIFAPGVKSDRAARRYRAIVELAALDKSDFEGVLRRILQTDADELEVERVNCWAFLHPPEAIHCLEGYLRSRSDFESGVILRANDYPAYFRALADDPIILADNAGTDPRMSEFRDSYLAPQGITSMMDVPIWVRGTLWGVLCHEHIGPPRQWSEAERDFALSIGHIISMAVEARERAEAERALRFSELFMGILSHDLRNPLATIRTCAEYLLTRTTDDGSCTLARRILTSSDRMTRLIEQLLDFTRIRLGGGLPILRREMDITELTQRIASDLATTHPGRRVDVQIMGDGRGVWDPDRIWQLLANLLGNALEHGVPDTPVWIHLDGSSADTVVIQVGNLGVLPATLLPVIFEPFRRAEVSEGRIEGLGLGLFIVREIVTAHAGSIACDTRLEETIFTVRLPRRLLHRELPAGDE